MKRFQVLVFAVFAVFAFAAVAASSAMAEEETTRCVPKTEGLWEIRSSTIQCGNDLGVPNSPWELVVFLLAEYLVGGVAVTSTLKTETTGEFLLEDKKATPGVKAVVLCSVTLVGTISANGEGEITELLTLGGTAVSGTVLSGTALLCNGQEGCTTGTENDEVWPVHLKWGDLLDLYESESPALVTGTTLLLVPPPPPPSLPGWYMLCATALGTVEDECTVEDYAAETSNLTGGVNVEFGETFALSVGAKLGNCTASSEKETGNIEGLGEEKVVGSSEVLDISSIG
jgi:hypothetical protein